MFYALLGMSLNAIKGHYTSVIQHRAATSALTCDLAKCVAFCANQCESMCTELESTDESFLAGISWSKEMCDVDGAKSVMKTVCEDFQDSDCDANCDAAW